MYSAHESRLKSCTPPSCTQKSCSLASSTVTTSSSPNMNSQVSADVFHPPATGRTAGTDSDENASGTVMPATLGSSNLSVIAGQVPVSANPHPRGAKPMSCCRNVVRSSSAKTKFSSQRHSDTLSTAAAVQHGTKSLTSGAGPGVARVRRWHIAVTAATCSSHGSSAFRAPPSDMSSSTVATSSPVSTISAAKNLSSARMSVHTSPVLILKPHAIGVKSTRSSKNVAFRTLSSPMTRPSQKHADASISCARRQHAGNAAGFGRWSSCLCMPTSQVIVTLGTCLRQSVLRYSASEVATSAITRTYRTARVSHPAESVTEYVTR